MISKKNANRLELHLGSSGYKRYGSYSVLIFFWYFKLSYQAYSELATLQQQPCYPILTCDNWNRGKSCWWIGLVGNKNTDGNARGRPMFWNEKMPLFWDCTALARCISKNENRVINFWCCSMCLIYSREETIGGGGWLYTILVGVAFWWKIHQHAINSTPTIWAGGAPATSSSKIINERSLCQSDLDYKWEDNMVYRIQWSL